MTATLYALTLPAYMVIGIRRYQTRLAKVAEAHEKAVARVAIRRRIKAA